MGSRGILAVAAVFSLVLPLRGAGSDGDAKKAEALVYQGIAELASIRDSVLQRYALMVTGETQYLHPKSTSRPPLRINRIYKLQAASKKESLQYRAHGKVMGPESSNVNFEFQYWTEFYQCGLKTKARTGASLNKGYKEKEKGESVKRFIEKNQLSYVHFEPFDDLVIHPMFIRNSLSQNGWIEEVFLFDAKLLSVETITQGDIRSKWRWKHHILDFEIELTQSKAYDYLPVHVKYTSKSQKRLKEFGETTIKWKKHTGSGKLLPYILKAATGSPFGTREEHHHWVLDWRLGKEIKDDFFDCDSADFRLNFEPLYDFEFDVFSRAAGLGTGGLGTGTPWKTPDELMDETTKQ